MSEPNLIVSSLSKNVEIEGYPFRVEVCRIDTKPGWTLEVVDQNGTSTVWDDLFDTDQDAMDEFNRTIKEEGIKPFLDDSNVIRFPTKTQ